MLVDVLICRHYWSGSGNVLAASGKEVLLLILGSFELGALIVLTLVTLEE